MTTSQPFDYPEAASDISFCRAIMKQHGTSYFFATKMFSFSIRAATQILYAWMRIPDDWVDSPSLSLETKQKLLEDWKHQWTQSASTPSAHPVLRSARAVCTYFGITEEETSAFLRAMTQDLTKTRYHTYQELTEYMYGSAGVVGVMMSKIIGCQPEALPFAIKNGYAMQLTNFLRDLGEDLNQRNRIYIPQEDLKKFGVTLRDLQTDHVTPPVKALLMFEIERARQLYQEAEAGISLLSPRGRFPVRIASRLYREILTKIEKNDYNVFTKRAHTTKTEKILLTLTTLIASWNHPKK